MSKLINGLNIGGYGKKFKFPRNSKPAAMKVAVAKMTGLLHPTDPASDLLHQSYHAGKAVTVVQHRNGKRVSKLDFDSGWNFLEVITWTALHGYCDEEIVIILMHYGKPQGMTGDQAEALILHALPVVEFIKQHTYKLVASNKFNKATFYA